MMNCKALKHNKANSVMTYMGGRAHTSLSDSIKMSTRRR